MAAISIKQIETPEEIDAVRALVREFTGFAFAQGPEVKTSYAFEDLEQQLTDLPGIFGPPDGAFLLAIVDGTAAGCVAFLAVGNGTCEVKRMYVRPEFRGRGLGERLLQSLIGRARMRGYEKMVLSTFHLQRAAQHLYAKAGFVGCPPTVDLPVHLMGKVVFMETFL